MIGGRIQMTFEVEVSARNWVRRFASFFKKGLIVVINKSENF